MGISASSGLLSGIDYYSIIEATLEVERQPIYSLQTNQSDYLAKISSYGSIKSALSNLQTATEALNDADSFISYSSSSSESDILTVDTDDDAGSGTYSITVHQIATTEIVNSYNGFEDTDSEIGTGTLSIALGESTATEITIDSENNTLEDIAEAINESDAGVSATVVQLSDDAYALSFTADTTGCAINLSVSDDDGDSTDEAGLSRLYADPASETLDVTQAAEKAMFTFNGLDIERESNTIDDLIPGVTIDLVSADSETEVVVEVEKKFSSMISSIESFVSAYNSAIEVFNSEQFYSADEGSAGILFGDYSATIIKNGLFNQLSMQMDCVDKNVSTLSAIGIHTTSDGLLEFDADTFNDAIESSEDDVIRFFTNDDDADPGFGVSFTDYLNAYTKTSGILDQKTESYNKIVDDIDDEIEETQLRLETKEESLWNYYNSLEEKLAELSSLQSAVNSMLTTLPSV